MPSRSLGSPSSRATILSIAPRTNAGGVRSSAPGGAPAQLLAGALVARVGK